MQQVITIETLGDERFAFYNFPKHPAYIISNKGRVYSYLSGRFKIPYANYHGYIRVKLNSTGYLLHRIIAILFIPNPLNKPQVNHKNGIHGDFSIDNLEWATSQENTLHGFRSNGRKISAKQMAIASRRFAGTNNPKAKINFEIANDIRKRRASGSSLKELSIDFSIGTSTVSAICNYKIWSQIGMANAT